MTRRDELPPPPADVPLPTLERMTGAQIENRWSAVRAALPATRLTQQGDTRLARREEER